MRLKILGVFVPFFLIFLNFSVFADDYDYYPDGYNANVEPTVSYDSECKLVTKIKKAYLIASGEYLESQLDDKLIEWAAYAQNVGYYDGFLLKKFAIGSYYYLKYIAFKDVIISVEEDPDIGDSDGDGVNDCRDQCPNTPSNVSVDSNGCPDPCVDNDGDGIPYAFDENVGMQDDYYFRYTTFMDSSGQITGYSILNENTGGYRKLGNPDVVNDVGFVSGRYHSSKMYEHFDCNEFTFNPNSKASPSEKADFQEVIDTNAPSVDQESDPEINPNDGDGSGSGNYATREDAAALEGAIKENSRIIRQDGESTRYAINKGFLDTGQKINKTNQILDGILKNTENFDVDTTGLETKLDDIINQDLEYQNFVKNKFEDFGNISAEKLSDFENVSVEDYYNSEKFSGELIEGEDFDSIIPLSDQTFIQDFLSNNPVLSALSSSKIETQNSKCDFILVTSLGTHEMDLCFLESGFNKAGVILLSLTTLFSLFVVVKK